MQPLTFRLSDHPFENEETVIAVFSDDQGNYQIQCAENLPDFFPEFIEKFKSVLSKEAREFATAYAETHITEFGTLKFSDDSGKIIADCTFSPDKCCSDSKLAVLLNGSEIYPTELEDIKLGAQNGYVCYGVVENNMVLSAAYTFASEDDIDGEVEIGVETISKHRGRGYASDCVCALAKHLSRKSIAVYYSYYEENTASKKLAASCGFECFSRGFEIVLRKER